MPGLRYLDLKAGGTLDPRRHIYISRPEDERLLSLLLAQNFCNVVSPRQMGKSSLMARTMHLLLQRGVRSVSVDLAGELGSSCNSASWYQGIIERIVRDLGLKIDVTKWWLGHLSKTDNQKLLQFFRDEVAGATKGPVVIFLDEIDSTLRLSYTDDLFTAIRTLHNERPFISEYQNITFCLLGVAVPNELIKSPTTTPYNIGDTIELRDFEEDREDLSALREVFGSEVGQASSILRRVLYWTGGHPYLTVRFCVELLRCGAGCAVDVDIYVKQNFSSFEKLSNDVHVRQIIDFVKERAADSGKVIEIYERIRYRERDERTLAHSDLRLSGLVKVSEEGFVVVRNRIYERLFDLDWIRSNKTIVERDVVNDILTKVQIPYGLAAVFASATISLFMYTASLRQELKVPREVRIVSTIEASGSTRGVESQEPVVVPRGVDSFLIDLRAPSLNHNSFKSYSVRILDQDGKLIWTSRSLPELKGDAINLLLYRSSLPEGKYELRLYGMMMDDISETIIARYTLPIEYR